MCSRVINAGILTGMNRSDKSFFSSDAIRLQHTAIRNVIAQIPRGCVASYGELAVRAGLPRRARLVGLVLRTAPASLRLPWHRVLRSDGRIAFPPASAEFREQRMRLRKEGVEVLNGRVNLHRYGWQRDLDAQLWAR